MGGNTVRIRELGGKWIIEQAGASISAPFPLTNELPGTDAYDAAINDSTLRFIEEFLDRRDTLPKELIHTARRIATETECLAESPPFHVKH